MTNGDGDGGSSGWALNICAMSRKGSSKVFSKRARIWIKSGEAFGSVSFPFSNHLPMR